MNETRVSGNTLCAMNGAPIQLAMVLLIAEKFNNAIVSTGFDVIDSRSINSETLLFLFHSSTIQLQLKQACSGTILTAINKEEFLEITLPIISKPLQNILKDKLNQIHLARQQAKRLLELAKHAVETAIEQSEEVAMALLNKR
jgi:restriction endonuclease S subunit